MSKCEAEREIKWHPVAVVIEAGQRWRKCLRGGGTELNVRGVGHLTVQWLDGECTDCP